MKRAALLMIALASVLIAVSPGRAQTGGVIAMSVLGPADQLGPLDPMTCRQATTCEIAALLFPDFLGVDPATQYFAPGAPGNSLVMDWTVSEDGLVYTFFLAQDRLWSDSEPVYARDVMFTYEARGGSFGFIRDVRMIDDFTIEVEYTTASCDALWDWNFGVLPAHFYEDNPLSVVDNPANEAPPVTSGPFRFGDANAERMVLLADSNYADGGMQARALELVGAVDDVEIYDQFLSGRTNFISVPVARMADARRLVGVETLTYPGPAWDYLGLNLADPNNPQPAITDAAEVDANRHPIFGDVRVRRALQHAINVRELIVTAVFGQAEQMPSYVNPSSWGYDATLSPVAYNPNEAERLLDEAGWVLGPDEVRVAQGAEYTPDGAEMRFTLTVPQGATRREIGAGLIRDQLAELGIIVDVQMVDFGTMLDVSYAQTFDAILFGWRDVFPADPAPLILLQAYDRPGTGNNFVSYYNQRVEDLYEQTKTVPNCDTRERASLFGEIQRIIQDDQPYLFLYAMNFMYAAWKIDGFDPYPNMPFWNVEDWLP